MEEYKYKKSIWISKKINLGNYENIDIGISYEIKGDIEEELNEKIKQYRIEATQILQEEENKFK